nr:uncharacterized protein LOC129261797 [Lytechinus pictus]
MPFLALKCFDAYGLRGCLLILTAIVFHGVPMAATLRPPRYSEGRFEEDNGNREDDAKDGVFEPLQPHCSSTADSANQTRNEIFPSDSTDLSTNILKQPVRHGFDQDVVSDCEIDPLKSGSYEMDSANQPESEGITVDADFMSPRSNEPNETRNLLHSAYNLIGNVVHDMFSFAKKECVFTFLLLPCQVLFDISYCCWEVFLFSYGISEGLTKYKAAYLLVMGSVGGIMGRLLLIAVLYKHPLLTTHLLTFNLAVSSFALLAYPINSSLTYLLSISFVAGFGFYASYSALFGTFPLKVQKENFPTAMACSLMLCGTAYLFSGLLAGFLYNMFGSYRVVFRILGISLAGICMVILIYIFVDSVRSKKRARSRLERE